MFGFSTLGSCSPATVEVLSCILEWEAHARVTEVGCLAAAEQFVGWQLADLSW